MLEKTELFKVLAVITIKTNSDKVIGDDKSLKRNIETKRFLTPKAKITFIKLSQVFIEIPIF